MTPEVAAKPPSGVVTPIALRWHQRVAAGLLAALIRAVAATLRFRWDDRSTHLDDPKRGAAIYCLWHNRLAFSMEAYHGYVKSRSRGAGLVAMVSASRDGGLLAGVLRSFGVQPVRGSTSRRGPQALRELTTWARRGYDIALTPDGPRGPRYKAQQGVIALAQLTDLPIIPFSCRPVWKIVTNSWDKFQIPLPFSRCDMIFGEPMRVPREATEIEREAFRLQLEQALQNITRD
jgi:lysophospholipid acyltransferase (LPLAT)-like uncharacterized protein